MDSETDFKPAKWITASIFDVKKTWFMSLGLVKSPSTKVASLFMNSLKRATWEISEFDKLSNILWYHKDERTGNDVLGFQKYQRNWYGKPSSIEERREEAKRDYSHHPRNWIEYGGITGMTRYLSIVNKYQRIIRNRENSYSWNSLKRRKSNFREKYDFSNNRDLYEIYDKVLAIQYNVRNDIEF